jgi:uncharacterized protein YkwD
MARPARLHHCALLLLAACAPQAGPERVVEPRTSAAPAPRGAALLRRAMQAGHDEARRAVGVPPLAWDAALEASARGYAEELARTARFAHAEQPQGPAREGENLWTGTRDAYRYDEMIGHWIAERRLLTGAPVPGSSSTGRFGDVAHYTQIVWRGSTRFGCAIASNARDDYLVCRYGAAGNVVGQRPY